MDTVARLVSENHKIFILTRSGKLVFSRGGIEEEFVGLSGVVLTLVALIEQRDGDKLLAIECSTSYIMFMHREPFIMVACVPNRGPRGFTRHCLTKTLDLVYNQVVSVLSLKYSMTTHRPLPLVQQVRLKLGDLLAKTIKTDDLIFALLIYNGQLVCCSKMKDQYLHVSDILIVLNLVASNRSFRNVESWIPICLPKFNSSGFLHAYISYLESQTCLVLLSANHESFNTLAERAKKFKEVGRYSSAYAFNHFSSQKFTKSKYDCLLKDLVVKGVLAGDQAYIYSLKAIVGPLKLQ
ncbi:hypothetical protein ACOME3_005164 [Neoechinorhynchus agilis]